MPSYSREARPEEWRLVPPLSELVIELTERCNNACLHCCINLPATDAEARAREMTTAQVQDILRQLAALGCLQVRYTGGEPLLRPDFSELYLTARQLGMKVVLFTNACLLTEALADLLAEVPPLAPVEVTVYGMRQASYEAVTRRPGAFARFQRGIQHLRERNIPFVVKTAALPPNLADLAALDAWACTLPWMRHVPGVSCAFDLRHRRDSAERNAEIAALRLAPECVVALYSRDVESYRATMTAFGRQFLNVAGDRLFTCGACTGRGGCVDAYARLQPCLTVRAPAYTIPLALPGRAADVNAVSLSAGLASFQRLSDCRATDPTYLRRCGQCFLRGLCDQCPGKSWIENGNDCTPVEYQCAVAHAQARWMGWLDAGEQAWEITDWQIRVGRQ